uniref:Uncharacterized protein n=1 Tax=Oryza brachyantha TaxID=4533 RepID=J3ME85_ORYBR
MNNSHYNFENQPCVQFYNLPLIYKYSQQIQEKNEGIGQLTLRFNQNKRCKTTLFRVDLRDW